VTKPKWEAEVKGVNQFLANVERLKLEDGHKWTEGMVEYYRLRLKDLYAHPPAPLRGKTIKVDITVELSYE